jgi:hypothetical protein
MAYIDKNNCPTLGDSLRGSQCTENFAGLGSNVYVGRQSDLTGKLSLDLSGDYPCVYEAPAFKAGKGLVKLECKNEGQKYEFESNGIGKGYKLTGTFVIDRINKEVSSILRGLNNFRDLFVIFYDNDKGWLVLYDPEYPVQAESGGISGGSGDTADSDREVTCAFVLNKSLYPFLYIKTPEDKTWDDLLASAQTDPQQ